MNLRRMDLPLSVIYKVYFDISLWTYDYFVYFSCIIDINALSIIVYLCYSGVNLTLTVSLESDISSTKSCMSLL